MNTFTIKDIENLSNIKAHTWRIWEQRYNLMVPERKESNHRLYTSDDLKKVLRISYLYHAGMKISKLAELDDQQLQELSIEKLLPENKQAYLAKQLIEAAIDLNEKSFTALLHEAVETLGVEDTILKVVYPFLKKVGLLWVTNHVIPAQEHFTSNLVVHQLLLATDSLPQPNAHAPCYVLFAPEQEHHEIPLLFMQYLLKKKGKRIHLLGQNTAVATLIAYHEVWPIQHLIFHVITNFSGKEIDNYLEKLATRFPAAEIIMTGPETSKVSGKANNVRLLKSEDEMLAFFNSL